MCGRITVLTFEEVREVVHLIELRYGENPGSSACGNPADPDLGRSDADPLARAHRCEPTDARVHSEQLNWDMSPDGHVARPQARPGSQLHIIGLNGNELGISQATWGIEALWNGKLVYNTRIESALGGSGMWARPINEGRCILPAATFFEPHANETVSSPKTGRPIKRNYEFSMTDEAPLLLASVRDGDRLSVVTTEPNAHVAPIHPRMPLVLRFEEVPLWLEGDLAGIAQLADRTALALESQPETPALRPARAQDDGQLSLF